MDREPLATAVFVPPLPVPTTVKAPAGYYFEAYDRPVVLTEYGAEDGDLVMPYWAGIYLGHISYIRRRPQAVAVPEVVATWQESEDAEPERAGYGGRA